MPCNIRMEESSNKVGDERRQNVSDRKEAGPGTCRCSGRARVELRTGYGAGVGRLVAGERVDLSRNIGAGEFAFDGGRDVAKVCEHLRFFIGGGFNFDNLKLWDSCPIRSSRDVGVSFVGEKFPFLQKRPFEQCLPRVVFKKQQFWLVRIRIPSITEWITHMRPLISGPQSSQLE